MLVFLLAMAVPAMADNVIYPPGSRIGLVPPPGLHASTSFPGFEDREKNVAMLLGALPAAAYAGQPFFRSAYQALRTRNVNMDVPISVGVMLALGMSLIAPGQWDLVLQGDAAGRRMFLSKNRVLLN